MDAFWIHRKASGSVSPIFSLRSPLARSTSLRVSKRSTRSATSASSVMICVYRLSAISIAGSRSLGVNGLTT